MKILEAQSAVLTNFEVYQFLNNQSKQYQEQEKKRRGPGNLETLRRELIQYFESRPGPLHQKPLPYDNDSIRKLLVRLRDYEITKGEMIMMINLRPTSTANLNTVIEDLVDRFTEAEQEDIVNGVIEVLGQFPEAAAAAAAQDDEMDVMESTEV